MANGERENLNMISVNITRFERLIREELEDENYDPIVGIGVSGIGKTECLPFICKKLKIGYMELRLVSLNDSDLIGLPDYIEHSDGSRTSTFASNDLLPRADRDGEIGLLVLDEFTSASPELQAACYQLLDSKRSIANYKLPPKWKVVALGNGPDDGGTYRNNTAAALSRCMCYRISPDIEAWKKWAIPSGVNDSVIAYLSSNPDMLHVLKDTEYASVFPCPRSWVALSKRLNSREKANGGPLDRDDVLIYAAGAVGLDNASEFATFYAFKKQSLNMIDVINNGEIPNLNNLQEEVISLAISSMCKYMAEEADKEVDDFDYSDGFIKKTANCMKFIYQLSFRRNELGVQAYQDLVNSVDNVNLVVMSARDEDDKRFITYFPEYPDMENKFNSIV